MSKKLITACLGLVALAAFALPAVASAQLPKVTHPTGTLLATGTKITATSVGTTFLKNDAGTENLAECESAVMTGTLTKNNGNTVEGTIETATFEGFPTEPLQNGMHECRGTFGNLVVTTNSNKDGETVANGTPWCVRSTEAMATREFQVRGGACNEAARAITFVMDTTSIFGTVQCKYTRSTPVVGTFTSDNVDGTDALMHLKANANTTFQVEENPFGICPSAGTLEMTFTMETDTATAEPLYLDH